MTEWGNQAFMTNFGSVVNTPSFLPRLLHTWVASWIIGSALVLSVSAWYLLKNRHQEFAKRNFSTAIKVFTVLAILQVVVFGAQMAISVTKNQPEKLASIEGNWTGSLALRSTSSAGWTRAPRRPMPSASRACWPPLVRELRRGRPASRSSRRTTGRLSTSRSRRTT